MTNEQLFEIGSKVFQRASSDPGYRALALRDGTAAVEEVIGRRVPDGLRIRFVENEGATFTLGLPPARTGEELSDRELEAVAGGRIGDFGDLTGSGQASVLPGGGNASR